MFAVGTEIHLVNRLGKRFADQGKKVITLDDSGCLCTTMFRISPQHLAWALENLADGTVVNRIRVAEDVKYWAKVALDRMLEIGPEEAAVGIRLSAKVSSRRWDQQDSWPT